MSNIYRPIFLPPIENNSEAETGKKSDEETEQKSDEETEEKLEESEPEPVIDKIKEKSPSKTYSKKGSFSRMKNFSCAIRGIFVVLFCIHYKNY